MSINNCSLVSEWNNFLVDKSRGFNHRVERFQSPKWDF